MYERIINKFNIQQKNLLPLESVFVVISFQYILKEFFGTQSLVVSNFDFNFRLKIVSIIFGLQLFPFLQIRPILKSILNLKSNLSIQSIFLFLVVTGYTLLIVSNDVFSFALYGSLFVFLVSLGISAETFFLVKNHKLPARFYAISVIPFFMGLIFFGNAVLVLTFDLNFYFFPFFSYTVIQLLASILHFNSDKIHLRMNSFVSDSTIVPADKHLLKHVSLADIEKKLNCFIQEKKHTDFKSSHLPDFAKYLGISLHQASYYLNQYKGLRFTDFINQYRIEEALLILSDNSQPVNLKKTALACGFSSYTPFFSAFKKVTGITPTDFVNQKNLNISFRF
ncbi:MULTISPECIES: helix-turn-helix domain-containing protein [unclassified Leptospira]|uniref:AraC family transcriptional regulator n=1 Tax=unclassified Leptospira TaxID=2633828 RepID=UPI0002926301|nr:MULTISPECIES: helix-turn-helix domain-containing protein [unclassified Leptospira]EKO79177.1 DNA-binding helix-turn-helix protein [Leptospira sp. Fiocruz LV3954]EMI69507.1 DNA-binding helix-turn-helix protein [Leptospira sp. Fiocruz LV4135]